jgi:hypothetical protein
MRLVGVLILISVVVTGSAWAQEPPIASAVRVDAPPIVDGVLDDVAWQTAASLTAFTQAEPLEGQPASEATDVRMPSRRIA